MITVYLRVSTAKQDNNNQLHGVLAYLKSKGIEHPSLYSIVEDKASAGIHWQKRKIGQILTQANKGDLIIVSELSRLCRSINEGLEIFMRAAEGEFTIHCVKESITMDASFQAKMMTTILSIVAEMSRALTKARTKETMARLKERNDLLPPDQRKQIGRPQTTAEKPAKRKLDVCRPEIESILERGPDITAKELAAHFGVARNTMKNYLANILTQPKQ